MRVYFFLLLLAVHFSCLNFTQAEEIVLVPQSIFNPAEGRYYHDYAIVISGQHIKQWIKKTDLAKNQVTIELSDLTLMPGLIDLHVHLNVDDFSGIYHSGGMSEDGKTNIQIGLINAKKTLLAGFTTVRNLATLHTMQKPVDIEIKKRIDMGSPGPNIIAAGHPIALRNSHCDPGHNAKEVSTDYHQGILDSYDDIDLARQAVRQQIQNGSQWIKVCLTPGALTPQKLNLSEEVLNEIVKIANKKELQVAAHALSSEGIRAAVKAGVSTIEHAHELTEADIKYIQETHWSGYIVPTLAITEYVKQGRVAPVIEKHFGQDYLYDYTVSAQESIKIAIENHLPLAFGTDAGMFPHAENSKEFSVLTRLGMSPLKAIQAATTIAAKVLKKSDIGTIQPGAMADIIGVRGKPTEDITLLEDIPWVMKNGVVYKE